MRHSGRRNGWLVSFIASASVLLGANGVLAQEEAHIVQPGETMFRIAMRYGVDVETLAAANNIANTWQIYAGQSLIIPSEESISAPVNEIIPVENIGPETYIVQRGDFLDSIARRYDLSQSELLELNNLTNPNLIYAGQELIVSIPTLDPITAAPEALPAEVVSEEVEAAIEEILPVEVAESPAVEAAVEEAAETVVEAAEEAAEDVQPRQTHIIQPGEQLASIANRYGVSWVDIARMNNITNPNIVYVGQSLIIPGEGESREPINRVGNEVHRDIGLLEAPAAPAAYQMEGRILLVDLSDSRVYAYEDGALVHNVLASTGLPATPTVQGDFAVYMKYEAQLMTGPGYYLPDVPWVMYFYSGYALHGAYWHNNWGVPMSHGCVNLPNEEARWFFEWAEVGTPVRVQA